VNFQSEKAALIVRNLTNFRARARVLYVTSGDDLAQANNIIDNHPATIFSFATNDGSPGAIIDLGKVTSVRRISAVYARRPGRMDFYVLQSLPGTETGSQALLIDGPRPMFTGVSDVTGSWKDELEIAGDFDADIHPRVVRLLDW